MRGSSNDDSIGTASISEDGTLRLALHRKFSTPLSFATVLIIKPDNPRYRKYLDHIGYICPGDRKSIPHWPA